MEVEVARGPAVGVHAHARRFRVLADVHRDPEGFGDLLSLFDGMVDPPIPRALAIDQYQLGIVQPDADYDGLRAFAAPPHEL